MSADSPTSQRTARTESPKRSAKRGDVALEIFDGAPHDRDGGAVGGERRGDRGADAAAAAGDDRMLTGENARSTAAHDVAFRRRVRSSCCLPVRYGSGHG